MKIVVATPLYPPQPGGPATYAKILEDRLPEYGIEVAIVKFSAVQKYPKILRHLIYSYNVYRAARVADLLMVQDTVSCGVPAVIAARFARIPLIVRVPGDYAWEQGRQRWRVTAGLDAFQTMRHPWQVEVLRSLQGWVVRQAVLVIVPSNYFAGIVRQWGVAESKLKVIYHGIEIPAELPTPARRPAGMLAVTAGRLVPWKGFAFLIRLIADLPDFTLVIVGDGPDGPSLRELAKEMDVAERVVFTGMLPRAETLGWCATADVFVLDTSFESFSFQIVEAMALGMPIVTTAVGSIPELIEDGKQGVLLAPDDAPAFREALESVKADKIIWKQRAEAARAKAKEFSVGHMLTSTADALRTLI